MKRQQAFVTFVAAISVLAGAGLLLLVQHVTDRLGVTYVPRYVFALPAPARPLSICVLGFARYGSDSRSLIFSLKAAVGQDGQGSQLWDEDTPLDWEEGASLLESSTSRTIEELRDGEARQRKTQGSGPQQRYRVSKQAGPLLQSKKGWQVWLLPTSLSNEQRKPATKTCTLWCSKGKRKRTTMWRCTRLEIIIPNHSPALDVTLCIAGDAEVAPGMLQVRAPQDTGGPWTKGRERSGPVLGCEQFQSQNFSWPQNLQTIAVVGNGPLTEQSRQEINVSARLGLVTQLPFPATQWIPEPRRAGKLSHQPQEHACCAGHGPGRPLQQAAELPLWGEI